MTFPRVGRLFRPRAGRPIALALGVGLLPLLATLWAAEALRTSAERARLERFEQDAAETILALRGRMEAYEQVLRGCAALFDASPGGVDRLGWRAYVRSLAVDERYPGLAGLGFAREVAADDLAAFEAAVRAEGATGYRVRPQGARDFYLPLQFVEPLEGNEGALGFDLGSDPVRREAALLARDTGRTTATRRISLAQDAAATPAFDLIQAVYRTDRSLDGVPARRAAFVGWVVAAFRGGDLMRGLSLHVRQDLEVEVFDGEVATPSRLLIDTDDHLDDPPAAEALLRTVTLDVAGRRWLVRLLSRPAAREPWGTRVAPAWILAGGLLGTLALAAFVWTLASTEARARDLAGRMSASTRAREARMRAVVDNVEDGILTLDTAGTIESVNPAVLSMFGYPAEELVGTRLERLFRREDEAGPTGLTLGPEGRRRDGSFFPVELAISELEVDGEALFTGIVRDVSARRRAERRRAVQLAAARVLAEGGPTEEALPGLLEALGRAMGWDYAGYWELDRRAGVCRNTAAWAAPGLEESFLQATRTYYPSPPTGLLGSAWRTREAAWVADLSTDAGFLREEARAAGLRTAAAFPVVLTGEVVGIVELLVRHSEPSDDELLQVLGTVGSQVGHFIDRRRSEEALRASEVRMRSVVDNMLEGLVVTNAASEIEAVNPAAERIFGYTAGELVGRHLKMLLPRARVADADAYLKEAHRLAMGRVTTWEGRRRNGEVFPFELSLYEFTSAEGRFFAGHVRDVSERRAVEKMKREFVATVSHELRTPLTSIRGSLGLLSAGVLGQLGPEAKEALGIAERNALHLIGLINDILDLERLENGRLEMDLRPMPLERALERAHEAVRGMAEAQGIAIALELTDGRVTGDEDRVVQVLVNLLSNAVKFSPRGGAVTVSVQEGPGFAEVAVRDRGRGIPPGMQRSIFERFQQVETSDARQKGGTGLGLAICKAIVEQHGGSIGLESEPGEGSTFWFRLPTAAAPPAPAPPPDVRASRAAAQMVV